MDTHDTVSDQAQQAAAATAAPSPSTQAALPLVTSNKQKMRSFFPRFL
jgi:hypothetical protein